MVRYLGCEASGCGAVGSALDWGSRGREFKSRHSDQKTPRFRKKSRSFSYYLSTNEVPGFRSGGIWVELRKNRVGKAPPEAVRENPAKARHFAGLRAFGLRPKTRPIVQIRDWRKYVNGENSVSAELKRARKRGRGRSQRSAKNTDWEKPARAENQPIGRTGRGAQIAQWRNSADWENAGDAVCANQREITWRSAQKWRGGLHGKERRPNLTDERSCQMGK